MICWPAAVGDGDAIGDGADVVLAVGAGAVALMSDDDGALEAVIDFHLVTKWKTAADSLLGALRLARSNSREVLIVGAGTVARSLVDAYGAGFPGARFTVWNRTRAGAERLAAETGEAPHRVGVVVGLGLGGRPQGGAGVRHVAVRGVDAMAAEEGEHPLPHPIPA